METTITKNPYVHTVTLQKNVNGKWTTIDSASTTGTKSIKFRLYEYGPRNELPCNHIYN
ncbi:hypothetical protein [Anaerocolumna sp. MB42-C2]|uniref:hypothetical protein n=1 Tax=Anaerocolumna sp. MB42-C2 TaxID=3070997 RepID=UPI0027E0C1BD|nr:hypothetical protein [Anaerocolumna sp. MB42-C2]WMJ87599.1 hypothetical protein RBU59_26790 [Anaerocolumna sp. MB42-C2]